MRGLAAVGVVALLAGAACGKSESECRAEAQGLQALLRAADTGPSVLYVDRDIALVPRPELAATARDLTYGDVVTINRDGRVRFQGVRDYGAREAIDEVYRARARRGGGDGDGDGKEPTLYLVIDAAAPWGVVSALVDHVKALELTGRVGFVFGVATAPSTPPPRNWMDDKLDKVLAGEPSERATGLAKALEPVVKPCAALSRLFGQVGSEAAENKSKVIIDGLEAALVECRCDLDVPALRSAMYRVLHDDHPAGAHLVTVDTDGTRVSAPDTAVWRDVAGQVLDVHGPLWVQYPD